MGVGSFEREMLNSRMISVRVKWARLLMYRIMTLIRSTFFIGPSKQYHILTCFKVMIDLSRKHKPQRSFNDDSISP